LEIKWYGWRSTALIELLTDCDGQVLRSLKIMDPTFLSLLDSIPQKPPRSELETHRELIRQLRRKGCTYRDIVRILHERVGLEVAVSTIHSFVKVRAKHRKQPQYELPPRGCQGQKCQRLAPTEHDESRTTKWRTSSSDWKTDLGCMDASCSERGIGAWICLGHVACKRKTNAMRNYKRSTIAADADDRGS
jgi:hypothetical protein